MVANLMGQIAKFFSGGKSGPKALLKEYSKFGQEEENTSLKERKQRHDVKLDNKKKAIKIFL